MIRSPVESSSLAEVGYDRANRCLEVSFVNGGVYRYFDVPEHVVDGLLGAPSIGRYFVESIRDRYDYEKLSPPNAG